MDNKEIKRVRPLNGPISETTAAGAGFSKLTKEEKNIRDAEAILQFLKHAKSAPEEGEFSFIYSTADSLEKSDTRHLEERIIEAFPFCVGEDYKKDMVNLFNRRFGGFPAEKIDPASPLPRQVNVKR